MSEDNTLLDTIERALRRLAEADADASAGWREAEALGLPLALVPEPAGGFGAQGVTAARIFGLLGANPPMAPLAESIMAALIVSRAGADTPAGPLTLAAGAKGDLADRRFSGLLRGVAALPGGYDVVARLPDGPPMILSSAHGQTVEGRNLAGERRDTLQFNNAPARVLGGSDPLTPFDYGALARAGQTAGALRTVLNMTVEQLRTRQQFGRALGSFQALQQMAAVLAAETNLLETAAQSGFAALAALDDPRFEIGALKLRANQAALRASAISHQLHGAMGFTLEHPLHRLTLRLVSWAGEFGNEQHWAPRLADMAFAAGADGFWDRLIGYDALLEGAAG